MSHFEGPEPSYWHHPMEDIEPAPDHSCSDGARALTRFFDSFAVPAGQGANYSASLRKFCVLLWVLDRGRYFGERALGQAADCIGMGPVAFTSTVRELEKLTGLRASAEGGGGQTHFHL